MASPPPDLARLLAALTRALRDADLPFMLIGGQAVLLHGRPRLTEDIDITLGVGPEHLPALLAACSVTGLTPLPADPAGFVAETFVLPARHAASGLRVDCIFSTTPYERDAIARAETVEIGGERVPVASAEDLVLHKLFAGRPRDLEDAVGVVQRKGVAMDWEYLRGVAAGFRDVPGREGLVAQVDALRRHAQQDPTS